MADMEINEMNEKMKKMDQLLNKNIFNNQVKEVHEKLRQDILEFKKIFQSNLENLSKSIQGGNINNGNEVQEDSEEVTDLKVGLEHKKYQVEILKKAFADYEKSSEEKIKQLQAENEMLKNKLNSLGITIENVDKKEVEKKEEKKEEKEPVVIEKKEEPKVEAKEEPKVEKKEEPKVETKEKPKEEANVETPREKPKKKKKKRVAEKPKEEE